MAEIIVTEQNFEAEVLNAAQPVLVDFWATWCGPCRMLAPVLEELAEEYEGRVTVGKVNVDEQPALATHFGIQSIPSVLIFKDGQLTETIVGFRPKQTYTAVLDQLC